MTDPSMNCLPADDLAAREAIVGSPDAKINPIPRMLGGSWGREHHAHRDGVDTGQLPLPMPC